MNINDSNIRPTLTFRRLVYLHMQQLTNFPYIEQDFDALTDYELLCLVVKYLNDVIDNSNEQNTSITNLYNAFLELQTYMNNSVQELEDEWNNKTSELEDAWTDKTTELETAFNNLQTWINNYFDNLDVQDEIDNKLDEMLEDGVLEQIIEQFLQSTAVWCFNTVADMKQATNLTNGSFAKTIGYYSANDGGSGLYKITNTQSQTEYQETLNSDLYATLIVNDVINVKQLGAYGDNDHDDTLAIQTALDIKPNIYIPNGTYKISDTLTSGQRTHITGEDKSNTIIKYTIEEENTKFMIQVGERSQIENIGLTGPYDGNTDRATYNLFKVCGLNLTNSPYCVVRNCRFAFLQYGVHLSEAWCCSFEHCYALRSYIGFDCRNTSANNDISFIDCQMEYNTYGAWLGEGRTQSFYNCDVENNLTSGIMKQNEGDIQITNCYFEDKVNFVYASRAIANILIEGSSFFQNPETLADAFTPITYTGDGNYTQISVINCNFKNLSQVAETHNTPCILREGNTSTTIKPIFINNTLYQMKEFDSNTFKGITINNGSIKDYNNRGYTYLSPDDGDRTLNPNGNDNTHYRVYLPAQNVNRNLTISPITEKNLNYEYNLIIPETVNSVTGTWTLTDTTDVKFHYLDNNTLSYSDRGKLIKLIYVGYYSNADNWQVIK